MPGDWIMKFYLLQFEEHIELDINTSVIFNMSNMRASILLKSHRTIGTWYLVNKIFEKEAVEKPWSWNVILPFAVLFPYLPFLTFTDPYNCIIIAQVYKVLFSDRARSSVNLRKRMLGTPHTLVQRTDYMLARKLKSAGVVDRRSCSTLGLLEFTDLVRYCSCC